jgi:uncharacterized protein DUF6148
MPGITLDQAETALAAWIAADAAVATGQSYTMAGRSLTRANAGEITAKIKFWDRQVKRLTDGGISIRQVTPVDA